MSLRLYPSLPADYYLFQVADIEAERIHGTLQFVTLKKLNRMSHFKCKKVRDDTNNVGVGRTLQ